MKLRLLLTVGDEVARARAGEGVPLLDASAEADATMGKQ